MDNVRGEMGILRRNLKEILEIEKHYNRNEEWRRGESVNWILPRKEFVSLKIGQRNFQNWNAQRRKGILKNTIREHPKVIRNFAKSIIGILEREKRVKEAEEIFEVIMPENIIKIN